MPEGRYSYNPAAVTSNFETFDKGDYVITLGQPKSFVNKEPDGSVRNFGIRFPFVMADGKYVGKRGVFTAYLHNEGSQSMTKRFQMAVLGYGGSSEDEKKFDVDQIGINWGDFDPENGTVGEPWNALKGANVISVMDVGQNNKTGDPQQNFKSWRPISSSK
jgi:hypothetical protein